MRGLEYISKRPRVGRGRLVLQLLQQRRAKRPLAARVQLVDPAAIHEVAASVRQALPYCQRPQMLWTRYGRQKLRVSGVRAATHTDPAVRPRLVGCPLDRVKAI